MRLRSFAMLLAAATLAACESSPTASLDHELLGSWLRMETSPTTVTDSTFLSEIWYFDGTYYSRSISELPKAGGTAIGVLTEMGTYTTHGSQLRLVRQALFERAPGTSPAAGGPGTEMKPVTPVPISTRATFRNGRLVLGGCESSTICIPGPYEYGAMLTSTAN